MLPLGLIGLEVRYYETERLRQKERRLQLVESADKRSPLSLTVADIQDTISIVSSCLREI